MFINFWYVTEMSENVTDAPVHVRMLGQDFVLFRNSAGHVSCLSNVCAHRGGSLADGKIKGDCVECPYHGWQFDSTGACTRIPSMGPQANIPARGKVNSYPTREKYGLIFAFLGDLPEEERPPIFEVEEWGQEGWTYTHQWFEWNFDYKRSIENAIDNAHNEYVHPTHGFKGTRDDYQLPPLDLIETEWGTGFHGKREAPPLHDEKMRGASKREVNAVIEGGTGHHGVSTLWTHIHPTKEVFIHQYLFETPIDESHTRLVLLNMRNFLIGREDDARFMERNQVVAEQDRDVLEAVRPVVTPPNNTHEVFVMHDSAIARYRDKLREWESWGWRIDVEAVNRTKDKTAYAIPSPQRRSSKNWAIDEIPLIGATERHKSAAEQCANSFCRVSTRSGQL